MPAKKPMTKTEIINHLSQRLKLTKAASKAVLDELSALAAKKTKTIGEFTVPGIGKLVKQRRKARKGRNPQTGEEIRLAARRVLTFKPSLVLKNILNVENAPQRGNGADSRI